MAVRIAIENKQAVRKRNRGDMDKPRRVRSFLDFAEVNIVRAFGGWILL
jgi:hypothetical protein